MNKEEIFTLSYKDLKPKSEPKANPFPEDIYKKSWKYR